MKEVTSFGRIEFGMLDVAALKAKPSDDLTPKEQAMVAFSYWKDANATDIASVAGAYENIQTVRVYRGDGGEYQFQFTTKIKPNLFSADRAATERKAREAQEREQRAANQTKPKPVKVNAKQDAKNKKKAEEMVRREKAAKQAHLRNLLRSPDAPRDLVFEIAQAQREAQAKQAFRAKTNPVVEKVTKLTPHQDRMNNQRKSFETTYGKPPKTAKRKA